MSASNPPRPVLIFDGDCGFCRRTVRKGREITGDAIEYLSQQSPDCARRFPGLDREALRISVHLVEPDGTVTRGAHAILRALATNPRWQWAVRLYARQRWVARVMEAVYAWVARHREGVSRITRPFFRE